MRDPSFDIAVTGMAGRFPGAANVGEWWAALRAGRILMRRLERDELLAAGASASECDDPDYVPVRGHLEDADRFDHRLFRVSPRDAELMDPQHRLMLEMSWAALEDAGAEFSPSNTAVFASGSGSGYLRAMLRRRELDPMTLDQALHGNEPDFIAGLISYKLGFSGPALAVQTACSSGLVGVHLAVQSLLNEECDQALVVAAGIDFPQAGQLPLPGGIYSPSGRCRPFDASADGVLPGSGVVAVVLRRLADALEENCSPHAVILGTAINNDGHDKTGFYAPSVVAQVALIQSALSVASVEGDSVGYLETHGTGTRVGDPIEWAAASEAFGGLGAGRQQIAIGALKANTGHLDAAAGLAGLVKTVCVVRDGVIPPVAGFERLNPLLEPTEESPLRVPTRCEPWSATIPRRASVSAFGIGGTNAHVLVEALPPRAADRAAAVRPVLVPLSASDEDTLSRLVGGIGEQITTPADITVVDVARTLASRAQLDVRSAVVASTPDELAAYLRNGVRIGTPARERRPVALAFPGQGSQRPGMAAPLAAALPGFAAALDRCLDALDVDGLAARLRPALFDETFSAPALEETELAQPAIFAMSVASADALRGLGIEPAVVIGHSLGEVVAACVAGALDLRAAAELVVERGLVMQACPPGTMLAVACGENMAHELLGAAGGALDVAAVNSPELTVVAGPTADVRRFQHWLDGRVWSKELRTSHAFHSRHMAAAVEPLATRATALSMGPLEIDFASATSGRIHPRGSLLSPDLFVDQVLQPVRFADAIDALRRAYPDAIVLEVGPGRALSVVCESSDMEAVALLGDPDAGEAGVLAALGGLWTAGVPVRVGELSRKGRKVHLPTYPFAGLRFRAPEIGHCDPVSSAKTSGASASPRPPRGSRSPDDVLGDLWQELLGHGANAEDADFFELGGDSMLVTVLARRLREALGIRVPLRLLLAGRTLAGQRAVIASAIESATGEPVEGID